MNTRKAKGPTTRARKSTPRDGGTLRQRLHALGRSIEQGASERLGRLGKSVEAIRAGFKTFGRSVGKNAAALKKALRAKPEDPAPLYARTPESRGDQQGAGKTGDAPEESCTPA